MSNDELEQLNLLLLRFYEEEADDGDLADVGKVRYAVQVTLEERT